MKYPHHDIGRYTLFVSLGVLFSLYIFLSHALETRNKFFSTWCSTTMGKPPAEEVAFGSLRSGSATFRCLSECRGCLDRPSRPQKIGLSWMREPRNLAEKLGDVFGNIGKTVTNLISNGMDHLNFERVLELKYFGI